MPTKKEILHWVTMGGHSQDEIARIVHASKRDVSACVAVAREAGLTHDQLVAMTAEEVESRFFPPGQRTRSGEGYLQPDLASYVARKKANRKLTVKYLHMEYLKQAAAEGRRAYSYQQFCKAFAAEADRTGATRHFVHAPGAKAFIDWCGDCAHLSDPVTGRRSKVYVLVVELPFSNRFWAEGFADTRQDSWQGGQADAFEFFGGVPGLLVPDNAPTVTNRSAPPGVTTLNEEYERFAFHYGTAVLPTRVRKPRDKSTSESTVNLVEQWVIAPSEEMGFRTLEEFNEFCKEQVLWLNARPFVGKDGSRDSVYEDEEREHMLPLPAERYVRCEWARPKVSPDYHVQVDYMRYSVPHGLVGKHVDARISRNDVTLFYGGEVVARHARLRGRRGQYSTDRSHMPANHRELDDPWSRGRFERWAGRVGPECERAISRLMDRHEVVEQSYVACRNILGLAKRHGSDVLERACARSNELGTYPTYQSIRNTIESLRHADAEERARTAEPTPPHQTPRGRAVDASEFSRGKGGDRRC